MTESFRIGTIAGVRVGVNWSVLVIFLLLLFGLAAGRFPALYPDLPQVAYFAAGAVAAVVFFLALLAHELRNPLAPLRNALELLRRSGGDPRMQERALAIMGRQLYQLVRLTDDLLDFTADQSVLGKPVGGDLRDGDVAGLRALGIDLDLVLLLEPADARDLGDAGHALQPVAQRPVLERSQLLEVVLARTIDQRVLVDPADGRRVRTDLRRDAGRELVAHAGQVLDDARARPVEVGAVLEHDVDERHPEHREAAYDLDLGRGEEGRDDRIGDLVLDQIGAPPHPLGEHDHLRVREVGKGVERRTADREHAPADEEPDAEEHEEGAPRAELDPARDHLMRSVGGSHDAAQAALRVEQELTARDHALAGVERELLAE